MESPDTPSSDAVDPTPLPAPPKKQKRKSPTSKKGPSVMSAEEKLSAKEVRRSKKLALIQQLKDEGKISGPEARRQAKKAGVVLAGDVDPDLSNTKDDPSIRSALERKYELQQKVIDIRGGKGISILDEQEKITFLNFLEVAMGRHAACRQMKIDYRRFLNTFQCDKDFRSEVTTVEESLLGLCMMNIYAQASAGDVGASAKFISIKQGQNQQILQNKLMFAEHALKKRAVEAQIDSIQPTNRPSFACFSDDELSRYVHITDKIKASEQCTPDELSDLGILSAKLIRANAPDSASNPDFIGDVAKNPLAIEQPKEDNE